MSVAMFRVLGYARTVERKEGDPDSLAMLYAVVDAAGRCYGVRYKLDDAERMARDLQTSAICAISAKVMSLGELPHGR